VSGVNAGSPDQAEHERSPLLVSGNKDQGGPLGPRSSGGAPASGDGRSR
jgi:hypothetical protein